MTEMIDITGTAFVFRRPDGSVLLDTRDRQPARDGYATFTGAMSWPSPSGATIEARIVGGGGYEFRYKYPGGSRSYTVDLGEAPAGYTPNFLLANINASRQQNRNIFGFIYAQQQIRDGEWRPMNMGSVWAEYIRTSNASDNPIAHRHFNVAIAAGRWVLELYETSRGYTSSWSRYFDGTGNAAATYNFTLDMAWGAFDL